MEQYNQGSYENEERKNKKLRIVLTVLTVVILIMTVMFFLIGFKVIDLSFFKFGGLGMGYTYKNADSYSIGSNEVMAAEISEIDIDWVSGSINVEVYDGDKIIFFEDEGLIENHQLRYKVEGGRLTIKYMKSGFFTVSVKSKDLVVKIPKDSKPYSLFRIDTVSASINAGNFTSDEVTLDTVSGSVDLTSVTCNLLKVESVSGRVNIADTTTEDFNCDNVSGSINFNGNADKIKADSVSGEISISSYTCPKTVNIESVSGSITFAIPENDGFEAKVDTVSGSFSCDFPTTKDRSKYVYKNGDASFSFDTVSGSVIIEKISSQ
ncbi:MAG: DUF4097 domain-containing protein [Clostridiales bacterium]|jgi:DUF4097 and DUF4098 domain-containing protein YvlB|nr:DUF4097 domain-containing protein [Clostridiales bacterium]